MQFNYQFPIVYADRKAVGTLAEALKAMPNFADQIMAAHGVAWANAAEPIADLQQKLADRDATIAQLKTKLSPDIAAILRDLLRVGLEEWAEAAITNANPEDGVFAMVLRLKETAQKQPYIGQCQDIKDLFGPICYYSKTVPTHDQATRMQLVLNIGPASTGPVGKEYLDFNPWIKSEES